MLPHLLLLGLPVLPIFALEPVEVAEIKNPKSDNADFGTALAWSADRLFIGAPYGFDNPDLLSGAVYAFESGTWSLKQPIKYPDDGLTFLFGSAVVVFEDRLVVGAPAETVGGKATAGAVYTLLFDGALWNDMPAWKLTVDTPEIGQRFGQSLAYDGKQLIVGVPGANTAMNQESDAGRIFVYEPTVDGWMLKQAFFSMPPLEGAELGQSLVLNGDRLVVSAPEGVSPMHVVFERDGNLVWAQQAVITPASLVSANCAMNAISTDISTSIGLQGDTILVGSPQNSELSSGAVSVLKFENNQWLCAQRLDPNTDTAESFGYSIAAHDDDLLFVGAVGNSDIDINNGAIYTFERDANSDTYILPPRKMVGTITQGWLGSVISSQGPYLAAQVNAQHMSGEPSVYIYEIRPSLGETCDGVLPCAVGVCSDGLCCSEECTGPCFQCAKELEPDPGTCEFVPDAPCSDGDRGCIDGMCQQPPEESSTGASGSETSDGRPTTGADDTSTGQAPTTSAGTDGSDSSVSEETSESTSASSDGVGFDPDTLFGCMCQSQGGGRDKTHEVLGVVVVMLTVRRRRPQAPQHLATGNRSLQDQS